MIISASYKTDIPAFYGEWFMNRLDAGFCMMVNPYNRKALRVDLGRPNVDGIVFWTKNLGPFIGRLAEVRSRGFPFVVQYTVNNYPRSLEHSVVDADRSVEHMHRLSSEYGSNVAVWRYDTIVVSSVTPLEFHRSNFRRLAALLEGATDEVVISFVQHYQKTIRNLTASAREAGFTLYDLEETAKRDLAAEFATVARAHGMQLSICSQRALLSPGVTDAKCVDAMRFESITGRPLNVKEKGNRPECGCYESRDIGDYDTCPHGCVYCYAVQKRDLALTRFRAHDPAGEFLYPTEIESESVPEPRHPKKQLRLF